MPRTKSSRKRQSRLDFTPLPSSSPAAKHYNEQIRNRAAAVMIQGSPSTTRHAHLLSGDDYDAILPTPSATAHDAPEDSDSEPVRTAQRRQDRSSPAPRASRSTRKSKARQQQLDFTRARHTDTFDAPVKVVSSRPVASGKGVFSSTAQSRVIELSSESDSDLPSAKKVKDNDKKGRVTRTSQGPVVLSDSEQEGTVVAKKPAARDLSADESSGDDMPTTKGRMPRKRKRRMSDNDFISDSPPPAVDSDDEVIEVRKPKRKRLQQTSDEEEERGGEMNQTVKTPRRRLAKRPRKLSQREKDDLAEDLADLGSSSDASSSPQPPRSTQSAEKYARQKALERLKRKRGRNLDVVSEAAEDPEEEEGGSDHDAESAAGDSEVEEAAPPLTTYQMFRADEEDDDFLVDEDDDDPLGIPEGMPLERRSIPAST
ncbi:hypothetical protein BST61_g868 [Cercospora zeina]